MGMASIDAIETSQQHQSAQITSFQAQMEDIIQMTKSMQYQTEMMRNLLLDLLDLAQLEKTSFKLNKTFFSLFEVIEQSFNVVNHIAYKKNIGLIEPQVNDELKECLSIMYGDKDRFSQVIINFLSNSLKFSDKNSKICLHLADISKQDLKYGDELVR